MHVEWHSFSTDAAILTATALRSLLMTKINWMWWHGRWNNHIFAFNFFLLPRLPRNPLLLAIRCNGFPLLLCCSRRAICRWWDISLASDISPLFLCVAKRGYYQTMRWELSEIKEVLIAALRFQEKAFIWKDCFFFQGLMMAKICRELFVSDVWWAIPYLFEYCLEEIAATSQHHVVLMCSKPIVTISTNGCSVSIKLDIG